MIGGFIEGDRVQWGDRWNAKKGLESINIGISAKPTKMGTILSYQKSWWQSSQEEKYIEKRLNSSKRNKKLVRKY